jgi:hypothetical protein
MAGQHRGMTTAKAAARAIFALTAAIVASSLRTAGSAQAEEPARAQEAASPWQFTFAPYAWATSLNGDMTARGRQVDVNQGFIDTIKESDSLIALEGRFEARYRDFGAYVDGIYAKLGVDDHLTTPLGVVGVDTTTEMVWVEAAAFYRIGRWPLEISPDATRTGTPALAIEPYAGVRYTSLGLDIDIGSAISAHQTRDWVDPIVGTRIIVDLSPRWQLIMSGDVGGFGVGSDFSWNLLGLVGYRFHLFGLDSSFLAGYRALSQDFDDGSGANRFEWDVTVHGPIMGLAMRF